MNLDNYSILIVAKYFENTTDYINIILVCKKFKKTLKKFRFNPIPVNSLLLFKKIETQYFYNQNDIKINDIYRFVICYKVSYTQSIEFEKEVIKCINIEYTKQDRNKYGNTILNNVKTIGKNCFKDDYEIKSIEIPSFVTLLKNCCFDYCTSLSEIKLPFGLKTIPNYCFLGCLSLKTIEIPQHVSLLKSSCFGYCTSLNSIKLSTNINNLSNYLFYNCSSLSYIDIPSSITSFNNCCFSNCINLKEIRLPTSIKTIGNNCFEEYGIDSLIIPSSVQTIGNECFMNCESLSSITIHNTNYKIGYDCFIGCTSLQIMNIPLDKYDTYPFKLSYNESLLFDTLQIKYRNVVFTENDLENEVANYKDIEIPDKINEINISSTFDEIKSITISTTCTKLKSFSIGNLVTSLYIPNSVKSFGKFLLLNNGSLTYINNLLSITSIQKYCFEGCYSLK